MSSRDAIQLIRDKLTGRQRAANKGAADYRMHEWIRDVEKLLHHIHIQHATHVVLASIVRDVAAVDLPYRNDWCVSCDVYCLNTETPGEIRDTEDHEHDPGCAWRRAREWTAQEPTQ